MQWPFSIRSPAELVVQARTIFPVSALVLFVLAPALLIFTFCNCSALEEAPTPLIVESVVEPAPQPQSEPVAEVESAPQPQEAEVELMPQDEPRTSFSSREPFDFTGFGLDPLYIERGESVNFIWRRYPSHSDKEQVAINGVQYHVGIESLRSLDFDRFRITFTNTLCIVELDEEGKLVRYWFYYRVDHLNSEEIVVQTHEDSSFRVKIFAVPYEDRYIYNGFEIIEGSDD